jgi:4-carboxymuconolactone decarboxylase
MVQARTRCDLAKIRVEPGASSAGMPGLPPESPIKGARMDTSESPILDLLSSMNLAGIEASSLDAQTMMLVRMAALVAVDAPPVSYMLNLEMAGEVDVDADQVQGMLAAIAPIVGSARVASAAGKMVRALGLEISLAELDEG